MSKFEEMLELEKRITNLLIELKKFRGKNETIFVCIRDGFIGFSAYSNGKKTLDVYFPEHYESK